jgi:hypothetical protein
MRTHTHTHTHIPFIDYIITQFNTFFRSFLLKQIIKVVTHMIQKQLNNWSKTRNSWRILKKFFPHMVTKNEKAKFYASIPIKFFKSKQFLQFFFDLQYTFYSSKSKQTE